MVPGLYTYEGFWSYFYDQLAVVGDELRRDQWVLGELANTTEIEGRLARLDRDLLERYRSEFIGAWNGLLDNLTLNSMVADKPQYAALGNAASASASPILVLVREVSAQTRLSREYEQLEGVDLEAEGESDEGGAGGVAGAIGQQLASRVQSRSSGVQRILLDAAAQQGGANALRAGSGGGGGGEQTNSVTAPIDAISKAFENWHMLAEGEPGQRPVDTLLGNLGLIWENLRLAEHNPDQSAAELPTLLNRLTQYNSQLPDPLARMVTRAEGDFRSGASDASIEVMNRALTDRISFSAATRSPRPIPSPMPRAACPSTISRAFSGRAERWTAISPNIWNPMSSAARKGWHGERTRK